ncbi:MFS transporter [Myceligenerans xiligouense]|uniref:Putative MFS family arabinose efflux permease n=1 Tax=Myceligenerans xiligouense TaxID=253184 RepID=A0A3N4YMF7_9MICO|nr:MFS transporter [Myceligenerans xiligouense]RPF20494.1 putative MFS family arabinose efflux permease [Myceligenerans xiligouense]
MIAVLRNPTYAKLFGAQVVALLGTGLLTVALGLLAFDIAGGDAGVVLGIAMTIKMVAYVGVAPVVSALTHRLPRGPLLVGADLVRAGVAVSLPFVAEAWQIYLLIFLLQSASATFTPAFQAVIPSVLPGEAAYTRALSLSRLAYDLESLVSPMLAAALLTVVTYHDLFAGTVAGFLASAALVLASRTPRVEAPPHTGFLDRLTRGVRAFRAGSELRGLLALDLVVATATAMVIVNTVVLVRGELGGTQSDVALLLGAYGAGSMAVALVVPALVDRTPDRRVMLTGATLLPILLLAAVPLMVGPGDAAQWVALLAVWFLLGAATSAILTPSARLLRRNSGEPNRQAVFAARFSLSHACFLVTYPLAGSLGALVGLPGVALVLAAIGAAGTVSAFRAWTRVRRLAAPALSVRRRRVR